MTIQYKDAKIFYTDTGKGNAVVLLHGFLENSTMWDPFIPSFAYNNRIICIDLLGHGKTDNLGYIHSMELMADCVKAVLDNLNIEKARLIGHSMGGYVALAFAEKYPDSISGLCLMNSTAEEDNEEKKTNRDRAIAAVKENHSLFVKLGIANLFSPKNRPTFSKEIEAIANEGLKTSLQGIIAALEGMKVRKDRTHVLKHNGLKKLLIASKNDPVLNFDNLIAQIKDTNTTLEIFPDGHMCHIENATLFKKTIAEFIK